MMRDFIMAIQSVVVYGHGPSNTMRTTSKITRHIVQFSGMRFQTMQMIKISKFQVSFEVFTNFQQNYMLVP